jgi:hypothetical protein
MRLLRWFVLVVVGCIGEASGFTICDLSPPAFAGEPITLSTRILFTMHGTALPGDKCAGKGQHGAELLFPGEKARHQLHLSLTRGLSRNCARSTDSPAVLPSLAPYFPDKSSTRKASVYVISAASRWATGMGKTAGCKELLSCRPWTKSIAVLNGQCCQSNYYVRATARGRGFSVRSALFERTSAGSAS